MALLIDDFLENTNKYNLKLKKIEIKKAELEHFFKYLNIEYYFKYNIQIMIDIVYSLTIDKNDTDFLTNLIIFHNCTKDTISLISEIEGNNKSFPLCFHNKEISLYKSFFKMVDTLKGINPNLIIEYIGDNNIIVLNTFKLINDNIIQKINSYKIRSKLDLVLNKNKFSHMRELLNKEKCNVDNMNYKIDKIYLFLKDNEKNADFGDFWLKEINEKK